MNSEKVEDPCFPFLFPHGEPEYTNAIKNCLSPSDYVMAGKLMRDKINCKFMTAVARYSYDSQIIDSCTGKPFESDDNSDQWNSIAYQVAYANI
jgi:hypothetical protein